MNDLTHIIDGGVEATKHRRWLWSPTSMHDNSYNYFLPREKLGKQPLPPLSLSSLTHSLSLSPDVTFK